MRWKIVLIVQLLAFSTQAVAEKISFAQADRESYLEESLKAFDKAKASYINDLYKYLRIVRTNNCVPVVKQLGIQCMIETAQKYCRSQKKECRLVSDIVTATLLEEPRIVNRRLKSKIAKSTKGSIQDAINEEMKRHYSIIALDLIASDHWDCKPTDFACLAKSIHRYCEDYSDSKSGSWQGCASGLVWYIGLHSKGR